MWGGKTKFKKYKDKKDGGEAASILTIHTRDVEQSSKL